MNGRKERFTTGPWQYANYTDFLEIQNTDPVNPKGIAYIDDWTDEHEAAANASLIAAAPEMYQMLQAILCMVDAYGSVTLRDNAAKKQIGNAVPPALAEALYRAVLSA